MDTQILEGTFAEVQQRLSELPLELNARLRIIVTEEKELTEEIETNAQTFAPTPTGEYRNGLLLLPRRTLPVPITLDLVKRLSEDDEEVWHANRTARR